MEFNCGLKFNFETFINLITNLLSCKYTFELFFHFIEIITTIFDSTSKFKHISFEVLLMFSCSFMSRYL